MVKYIHPVVLSFVTYQIRDNMEHELQLASHNLILSDKHMRSSICRSCSFRKPEAISLESYQQPHQKAHQGKTYLPIVVFIWNFKWLLDYHHCSFLYSFQKLREPHLMFLLLFLQDLKDLPSEATLPLLLAPYSILPSMSKRKTLIHRS